MFFSGQNEKEPLSGGSFSLEKEEVIMKKAKSSSSEEAYKQFVGRAVRGYFGMTSFYPGIMSPQ